MSKWLQENFPYLMIVISFLIAFLFFVIPALFPFVPSFFPEFVATMLGVSVGASLTLLQIIERQKRAHNKFLRDIHIELKNNSNLLDGHGNILNTDIWDSGISSGSILVIDSKELEELSEIYHQIETNTYEAKICRQVGEKYRSLPESLARDQAHRNWNGLSKLLHTREPDLKKQIDDFLKISGKKQE